MKRVLIPLVIILIIPLFLSQPVHSKSFKASGFSKGGSRVSGFRSNGIGRNGFSGVRSGLSNKGVNSNLRGSSFKNDRGLVKSSFQNNRISTRSSNNFSDNNNNSNLQTSNPNKVRPVSNSPVISNVKQDRVRFGKRGSNGFNTVRSNGLNSNSLNNRLITRGNLRKNEFNSKEVNKSPLNFNKVSYVSKGSKINGFTRLSKGNNYKGPRQSFKTRILNNKNSNRAVGNQSDLHTRKTDIVHWIDRKNGVKNFSNNINRIPEDGKGITTRNGKRSNPPYRLSTNNTTTSNIKPLRVASTSQNRSNTSIRQTNSLNNGFRRRNNSLNSNDRIISSPFNSQNHKIRNREQNPNSGDGNRIKLAKNRQFIHDSSHNNFDPDNGSHHTLKSQKNLHHNNHFHHKHRFHHKHFSPFNPIFIDNPFFFPPFFPSSSFFFVSSPFITPAFINFVPFVFVPVPFIAIPIFSPFIIQPVFFDPFFTTFPFQNNIFFTSFFFD